MTSTRDERNYLSTHIDTRLTRRQLLWRGAILGLGVSVSSSLLAACAEDDDEPDTDVGAESDDEPEEEDVSEEDEEPAEEDEDEAEPESDEERILTVAVPSEPPHIGPGDSSSIQPDLMYHVYRKLYKFNPDMDIEQDLVESAEVSEEGTIWTIELEQGVTFFDGNPVDAEAIRYSIQRMVDRELPMSILFTAIQDIRVVDDHTLELETAEPFASLTNNLAHPNAGAISQEADEELGDAFGRAPVSCGPYMVDEWRTGDRITLTRFPDYTGPEPYFDTIHFNVVPTEETRMSLLEAGDTDVGIRMPVSMLSAAEDNPDLQVIRLEGTRLMYYFFALDKPPLDDIRVREALSLAVDRDALIEEVALGAAAPATGHVHNLITFSIDVGELEYDPDRARELLEEAGAVGETISIVASDGNHAFDGQVAQALVGFFDEVGITAELELFPDNAAYTDRLGQREDHMGLVAWGGATGDPDHFLKRQFWGEIAGEPWNFANYNNPEVDALIAEGGQTFDEDERAEIYAEIQQILWDDRPALIIYRMTSLAYARADISGIQTFPGSESNVYTEARRG